MKSIIIHEFMIRELKLSGVKLLLFALIYSFSQFGSGFFVKDKIVCQYLGISRSQYYSAKKDLIINNYVVEKDNKLYSSVMDWDHYIDDKDLQEAIRLARLNVYDMD